MKKEEKLIKELRKTLTEVVDWVEANVAYGLPDKLLKRACDAIKAAKPKTKRK